MTNTLSMKTCRVCNQHKPVEEFNAGRNECRDCQKKLQRERYWSKKGKVANITEKTCSACGFVLPISKFDTQCCTKDGYRTICKDCCNKRRKQWRYRVGEDKPASSTHARNVYLGITIGEEIASRYFKNPVKAPYGTPGYDLVCQNGFKIDVKLATIGKNGSWTFGIKNRTGTKPDYYLFLAMESIETMNIQHIWLIPSNAIIGQRELSGRTSFGISPTTVHKLAKYEKPIDRIDCICNTWKSSDMVNKSTADYIS